MDHVARLGIRIIDARDEGAAVHMAHAHAELIGVAMATAGPGVRNTQNIAPKITQNNFPNHRSKPPKPGHQALKKDQKSHADGPHRSILEYLSS